MTPPGFGGPVAFFDRSPDCGTTTIDKYFIYLIQIKEKVRTYKDTKPP